MFGNCIHIIIFELTLTMTLLLNDVLVMYCIILVLSSFVFFFRSVFHHCSEIYNIVSQKQMRDPPEGDTIRPTNIEPIDVKPTVNSDNVRKQCCQSS